MVRKATPDLGLRPDELAAADEAMRGAQDPARLTERRPSPWRGSGGRWLVWAFRVVIWAVLLIVGFRGVEAIATGARQSSDGHGSAPAAVGSSGFPAGLAGAFALEFGSVYLNFSPATAARRASDLTPFIPVGSAPEFGWNGAGSEQLQSEQVASISVQSAHRAIVTLLARVSTGLIELAVPVYSAQGGVVVSADPALLPVPERAQPPSVPSPANDSVAMAALTGQLPGFFRAYASGNQQVLGRFLAPGASVTGLSGAVTFGSISGMEVPPGGATRRIAVSVIWQFPGQPSPRPRDRRSARISSVSAAPPRLEMTYEMTVVRQNGTWYVQAIGPSVEEPGGP
jgi:Conjugative transposon protein TcpC